MSFPAAILLLILSLYRSDQPFRFLEHLMSLPFEGTTARHLIPAMLVALFVLAFPFSRRAIRNGFNWVGLGGQIRTTLALLPLWFPFVFLIRILDPGYDDWMVTTRFHGGFDLPLLVMSGSIIVVMKEELLERGLLQPLAEQGFSPRWTAIFMVLGFSIFHLHAGDPTWKGLSTFVGVASGAFLLVAAYRLTGSVLVAFLLHLMFNATAILSTWLHLSGRLAWEMVFWGLFGLFSIYALPSGVRVLRNAFPPSERPTSLLEPAIVILISILVPLGFLFL
jgi:membrane protease YdiL (CAAX protease family)